MGKTTVPTTSKNPTMLSVGVWKNMAVNKTPLNAKKIKTTEDITVALNLISNVRDAPFTEKK